MGRLGSVNSTSSDAIEKARSECTFCGECSEGCRFLSKYDIVIGDLEELDGRKWSCFLCGRCSRVCPQGIDGMQVVWDMRFIEAATRGSIKTLRRGGLYCLEKIRYPFQNYHRAKRLSFFPGCSFLSNLPRTTEKVYELLRESVDAGIVFDCCGSPVHELGLGDIASDIVGRLSERFSRHGVEEILTACPHCYELLNGRIPQKVFTVYDALTKDQLKPIGEMKLYPPCPDRRMGYPMLESLKGLLSHKPSLEQRSQCCGLGGNAAREEPELASELAMDVAASDVVSYCASCAYAMDSMAGCSGRHVLSMLVGVDETADSGTSFSNRVRSKFL